MTEPNATGFTPNQDGSIDIPMEGKPTRFVKETDLLAVKRANEERVKQWDSERATFTSKVEESTKAHETTRQQLLQEQAAKEAVVAKFADYDTLKTKVGEQDKTLKEHQTSLQKHQEELVGRIKSSLITSGAKEESLKDKTLDQLRNLEEAARIFGTQGKKPANYDGGTGGGSSSESPTERAHRIIEAQEKRQGVMRVSSAAIK